MMHIRWTLLLVCLATAMLLMTSSANAQTAAKKQVAFTWLRAQGAETCPAQEVVVGQLEEALGPDVLADDAPRIIEAIVSRKEDTWRVAIYERLQNRTRFFREITDTSSDCNALSTASVAVINVLIDSEPPMPKCTPCTVTECPPCPVPKKPFWKTSVGARGGIRYGILPGSAPDFGVIAGLSHGHWEISGGMSWMPEVRDAAEPRATFGLTDARLGGCLHMRTVPEPIVSLCGYGIAGVIHAYSADKTLVVVDPGEEITAAFALAPRLRRHISWFFFEAGVEILVPVRRYHFDVKQESGDNWVPGIPFEQSVLSGSVFLGLGVSMP